MKLKNIATFIAASMLTIGGTAFFSNNVISAPFIDNNLGLSDFFSAQLILVQQLIPVQQLITVNLLQLVLARKQKEPSKY